jgi:hypothetical protein
MVKCKMLSHQSDSEKYGCYRNKDFNKKIFVAHKTLLIILNLFQG